MRSRSDSDQSISDEEDVDVDDVRHGAANADKKEGLLLQTRLEILRAKQEQSWEKNSNSLHKTNLLKEDEVEAPDFPDDADLNISTRAEYIQRTKADTKYTRSKDTATTAAGQSGQEANVPSLAGPMKHDGLSMKKYILSKDTAASAAGRSRQEPNVPSLAGAVKHEGWSMVSKTARAPIHLNKTSCSSLRQTRKPSKVVKGRTKHKFSFRFQPSISVKENDSLSKLHECSDRPEAIKSINVENSMQWVVCDSDEENESCRKISHTKVEPVGNRVLEHSMAELLDGIQDKNILSKGNSSLVSHHQDRQLVNPEKKESIVDRFEEALATTTFSNDGSPFIGPKQSSNGLFGKLQLLIQSEKQRDAGFMKKLQMGSIPNDVSHSITVKILARYLEAKLTICVCSFAKGMKEASQPGSFMAYVDGGTKKTVVFNPRVCSHVDLEVGNWIRIHSPWKEIQVMGSDESFILSPYFYQVFG